MLACKGKSLLKLVLPGILYRVTNFVLHQSGGFAWAKGLAPVLSILKWERGRERNNYYIYGRPRRDTLNPYKAVRPKPMTAVSQPVLGIWQP